MGSERTSPRWWQGTTIYQVYPRSFADSDGDGIGDLRGIIDHLDHLVGLGVETLWVSPFFASPQRDVGYDVTDYRDVAPEYGTLADAEALVDAAHERGLKVLFDLVLNHTSDEHPWFVESRSSRTDPRADWYLWHDGRGEDGRKPPNNWRCALETRSAWQWDETRRQWYLASFLPFQPDLNWRNPEVRAEMLDVLRFWLDRGVDGFRLDIFGSIMKDPDLRPNPFRPHVGGGDVAQLWRRDHTQNTPDNLHLAKVLREVCEEYEPERALLGEVFGPAEVLRGYLGDDDGLHLVFLFDFLTFRYDAGWVRDRIAEFERDLPEPLQPCYVVENHDRSRSIDRLGGDLARARVLALVLCTLRGTITLYQGQELGMANTPIPLADAMDPIPGTFFRWLPEVVARRLPERVNRDEVRTPMQWDSTANAGVLPAGGGPVAAGPPQRPGAQRRRPAGPARLAAGALPRPAGAPGRHAGPAPRHPRPAPGRPGHRGGLPPRRRPGRCRRGRRQPGRRPGGGRCRGRRGAAGHRRALHAGRGHASPGRRRRRGGGAGGPVDRGVGVPAPAPGSSAADRTQRPGRPATRSAPWPPRPCGPRPSTGSDGSR